MGQYLIRRGTAGWMIWDRNRKGPAVARHQELINFGSSQQAQVVLDDNLARGTLVDKSDDQSRDVTDTDLSSNGRAGNFEVFEISPDGTRERLLARLSAFDDAKAIAEITKGKSRIVVHFGDIVWPKNLGTG